MAWTKGLSGPKFSHEDSSCQSQQVKDNVVQQTSEKETGTGGVATSAVCFSQGVSQTCKPTDSTSLPLEEATAKDHPTSTHHSESDDEEEDDEDDELEVEGPPMEPEPSDKAPALAALAAAALAFAVDFALVLAALAFALRFGAGRSKTESGTTSTSGRRRDAA